MKFDVKEWFDHLFGPLPRPAAESISAEKDAESIFVDWVRRPDCDGRMGWELPGLSENERWWARAHFEDMPEIPDGLSIGVPLGALARAPDGLPAKSHLADYQLLQSS